MAWCLVSVIQGSLFGVKIINDLFSNNKDKQEIVASEIRTLKSDDTGYLPGSSFENFDVDGDGILDIVMSSINTDSNRFSIEAETYTQHNDSTFSLQLCNDLSLRNISEKMTNDLDENGNRKNFIRIKD